MPYGYLCRFFLFLLLTPLIARGEQLTPVSLQLIWKHQFQFAGYYMAREKGFYRDAGIDLTIHEYENAIDPVEEVISGRSNFAIGRSTVLAQKIKGAGIIALLSAYQSSPLMLLTTAESGISTPEQLYGKRIMMTPDAENQVELLAMMHRAGVQKADFIRQDHSFDVNSLISGETDAMASYLSNEPFQLDQKGVQHHIIHPKDFGFSMYSDLLITSEQFIQHNPELVEAFRQATIEGWLYAFGNIEETVDVILQHYNSQQRSRDALLFEGRKLATLAFDENGNFGTLDTEKLQVMSQIYLLFNLVDADHKLENFVYRPPNLSMLPLTREEQLFLRKQRSLKMCGDPLWEPFSRLNFNQYEGIIPDYMSLIAKRTGLNFETLTTPVWLQPEAAMKIAECDLIAGAMQTPQRAEYLRFSRPYLSMPAVLAVRQDLSDHPTLREILRQPVAVLQNSAFVEIIKSRYPDSKLVEVVSVEIGLNMLQKGEVVAMLDAADSISNVVQRYKLSGIKVIDQVHDNWDISIAVNPKLADTPLLSILNKAISSLSEEDHRQIRSKWVKVTFEHQTDYSILWQVLLGSSLLVLFLTYRYRVIQLHNRQLREMARHDQLTGLYNRRLLHQILEESVAIASRYQRPLSLIFFDIDDFKQINDQYGHNIGDQVLKAIAGVLQDNCRSTDTYGRWGGEEFIIILPESQLKSALISAEKIRKAVAESHSQETGLPGITCSFGVAEFCEAETADSLLNRADQALYRAKAAGKNCVCYDEITLL
ncbi:MAG: diguanylate cyclase [Amphritea sp.]|nr:diguanylate cyclase [Amphritea sp.]